jgi:hypothetical protein
MIYKVCINTCYGSFGLSDAAWEALCKKKGSDLERWDTSIDRHDPDLIDIVERMGWEKAGGEGTRLSVQTVRGPRYHICEYDGLEQIIDPENPNDWTVIG